MAEWVIAPGDAEQEAAGWVVGVGEPALTAEGDISFAVVYMATKDASPYNKLEIDPWYLPRKAKE